MISENHKKKSSLSISKTVSSAVRSMHPSTFCNSLKYQSYVMEYQIVIKVLTRTSQANSNAQVSLTFIKNTFSEKVYFLQVDTWKTGLVCNFDILKHIYTVFLSPFSVRFVL